MNRVQTTIPLIQAATPLASTTNSLGWLAAAGRPAKLYDLLCVMPLVVWYGGCVYLEALQLMQDFSNADAVRAEVFAILVFASKVLAFAFGVVLICLLVVRRTPIHKSEGWVPRTIALLGCYVGIGALVMPSDPPETPLVFVSMFLIVAGTGFAIYSLVWLGRSISILPESRKLVTSGPYALVRHPLYLGEQTALLGIALQATDIWAPLVLALQFACQFYRMRYEEKVLAASFPEYSDYCLDVARIIPWLY